MSSSNPQDPTQSTKRISFPFNSQTRTFETTSYNPSLVDNKLSPQELNDTLSQISYLYKNKEKQILGTLFIGSTTVIAINTYFLEIYRPVPEWVRPYGKPLNIVAFTIIGYYLWRSHRRAYKDAYELLTQANLRLSPKGLRWSFPQVFEKIELCPDYKLYYSKTAINEEADGLPVK